MFERFIPGMKNKEEKAIIAAEARQQNFIKQQQSFEAGASEPHNEQTYNDYIGERSDFLRWQQELEDELEFIKHRLKGEMQVDGRWVKAPNVEPLCNEHFIYYLETDIKPFLSRNLINSNFTELQILNMLKLTMNDICDNMADNWDVYEIDFLNYDKIGRLIKNICNPAPFRALQGWTKKIDSTMIKRIEASQESMNDNQNKKKWLGLVG